MKDTQCVAFLQWALPRLRMRWPGFRKVRKQVCKRVDRRLRELELHDVSAYRDYLESHPDEWPVLDSFCRISISRFYRDRGVFDYLRDAILPSLAGLLRDRGESRLRCWSAGCASGEEAYTLAILWKLELAERFPDVSLDVTATDIDPHLLARARHGCYSHSSLKDFPRTWLPVAFTQSDDLMCVKPEFRHPVQFFLQDIRQEMPDGVFHLVLCRHVVFTYLDEPLQQTILKRILTKLAPGGFLVTGKQEPLPAHAACLRESAPHMGVYEV